MKFNSEHIKLSEMSQINIFLKNKLKNW